MTKSEFTDKADQLFWQYEREKFEYSGRYCYMTELIFRFADYVDELKDEELLEFLASEDKAKAGQFRCLLQKGIDRWLQDNAKTMLIM